MDDFIYEDINVNSPNRNVSLGIYMKERIFTSPRIEVYDSTAFGRCLYLDGALQCSEFDEHIYHEVLVHTAFADRVPQNVLIIGGGDGGTLREVLKYKGKGLEKVTFVEINPEVIEVCKKYFPCTELEKNLADPIVKLVIQDAAEYLKDFYGERFDAVIIDCPDPSPESNVLFSREFIECSLAPVLTHKGVVAIQAGNVFIKEKFVRALRYELNRVFKRSIYRYAPMPSFPTGGIGFLFSGHVRTYQNFKDASIPTRYLTQFNSGTCGEMVPKSFNTNKRIEALSWYTKNIQDITKAWRPSPAATEVFRAFLQLEDEPNIDPQHTLMSFMLCFVPEIRVQDVNFWTNEPEKVKDAIDNFLKERLAFPAKDYPIHGISFSDLSFATHQLIKVEQLKDIDERLYAKKPEICFDDAVLSYTFLNNGERVGETVTFSDLTKEYVVNPFDEKPAEFLLVKNQRHPWRDRLEPSIVEKFDKMTEGGMMLDKVLWVHRGRANLQFRVV